MNIFKRMAGKSLGGIATILSVLFDVLISVTELAGNFVKGIARGFLVLIGMGGCFLLLLLAGPMGIFILTNPVALLTILFLILFPILANKFLARLKYRQYILTNYLFDRAKYLTDGVSYNFETLDDYKNEYIRLEEEKWRKEYERQRREQEKRQEQQQKEWEERFRNWNQYQSGGQGRSQGGYQTYTNPTSEFKTKYEESCDLLGVGYGSSSSDIKLAYRKKAKEYHPDLNKSSNATEMFQKVNNAYEFLSDGNIDRYRTLN